jgi:hypothetical protein
VRPDHVGDGGLSHLKVRPEISGEPSAVAGAPLSPAGAITPAAMDSDMHAE